MSIYMGRINNSYYVLATNHLTAIRTNALNLLLVTT